MNRFKSYVLLAILPALSACGGQQNNPDVSDMAEFAKDTAFQEQHDEPRAIAYTGSGKMIDIPATDGTSGKAYAVISPEKSNKYLLVIHEWWGLNDFVKREADRLAVSLGNVNVIALDLYDGKVATTAEKAGEFMQSVSQERAKAIIEGAIEMAGDGAAIGTIGWCFGGGWSLQASIMAGNKGKACVMYYGMPVTKANELAPMKADVLGIFAKRDGWITPEVVANFEQLAKATNISLKVHSFDADHAFANPTQKSYVEEAAQQANALAVNFLKERL